MIRRLVLFLKMIATGSVLIMLSACYGVIYEVMYGVPMALGRTVRTVRSTDGWPIPGIQVQYRVFGDGYSGEWQTAGESEDDGIIDINDAPVSNGVTSMHIRANDIDGPLNGGEFLSATISADEEYEEIELHPVDPAE